MRIPLSLVDLRCQETCQETPAATESLWYASRCRAANGNPGYVCKSERAKTVDDALKSHGTLITVYAENNNGDDYYLWAGLASGAGFGPTPYVVWDPHSALKVSEGGWQSPAIGLIHELYHAYQDLVRKDIAVHVGTTRTLHHPSGATQIEKLEVSATSWEAGVVEQLTRLGNTNETKRITYIRHVGTQNVKSVTATGT